MTSASDRDLQKVLLESTGMVTELLEALSGEPIAAERLRHETVAAAADNPINIDEGHELLHRSALLRGLMTHTPYLYAESVIACNRLPVGTCMQLQQTNVPIGRALAARGLSFRRTPLGEPRCPPMSSDEELLALIRSADTKRSYSIIIDDVSAIVIDEWFLPAAVAANRTIGRT